MRLPNKRFSITEFGYRQVTSFAAEATVSEQDEPSLLDDFLSEQIAKEELEAVDELFDMLSEEKFT